MDPCDGTGLNHDVVKELTGAETVRMFDIAPGADGAERGVEQLDCLDEEAVRRKLAGCDFAVTSPPYERTKGMRIVRNVLAATKMGGLFRVQGEMTYPRAGDAREVWLDAVLYKALLVMALRVNPGSAAPAMKHDAWLLLVKAETPAAVMDRLPLRHRMFPGMYCLVTETPELSQRMGVVTEPRTRRQVREAGGAPPPAHQPEKRTRAAAPKRKAPRGRRMPCDSDDTDGDSDG